MRVLVLTLALLAFSPPVLAQSQSGNAAASAIFNEVERRLIRDFFGTQAGGSGKPEFKQGKKGKKAKGMPPGHARRAGGLPPGLAKRGGMLPPGLAKKPLPPGLSGLLPPLAPGTARYVVDNDVVLIQKATGLILDILSGVAK